VKGAKRLGVRIGNWLTVEQSKKLLQGLPSETVRGKRDRAIVALLRGVTAVAIMLPVSNAGLVANVFAAESGVSYMPML